MKTRQDKLRKPRSQKEALPEASVGGILASTAIGAGTGAIGGGGVLSVPGAIIGGAVGLATGLWDHFKEKKAEKAQDKANLALAQQSSGVALSGQGSTNNYTDMWTAAYGGVVPGGNPNVELEKNEVTMGPDGTMKQFNLPPHPNSSRIPLEPGTVVFSDNPKLRMPDGRLPAEAAESLKKAKNASQKILDNKNASPLARKSAERNIYNIDKQLGKILGFQMEKTQELGEGNNMNADGTEVTTWGTLIKGAGKFLGSEAGKQTLQGIATLAPIGYNAIKGTQKVEQLNPAAFQNPMAYGALDSMRNREYNMTPALQATDESMAAANANLRSTASGRGQYAAGAAAMANAGMKQKAAIYAQGSQMRNQYLGEYGQMQAGLGQKMADTNLIVSDINAKNEAAGRNYGAAAMGQLSQWSQIQQQMQGQRTRDAQLMEQFKSWNDMLKLQSPKINSVPNPAMPQLYNTPRPNTLAPGPVRPTNNPYFDGWQMQGGTINYN